VVEAASEDKEPIFVVKVASEGKRPNVKSSSSNIHI